VSLVRPPWSGLVALVLVLAAALLLRELASLLVPFLFGAFLVAWPMVAALERRRSPRPVALGLTIATVLVVVVGAVAVVAVSVAQLVVLVPRYEARLDTLIASVRDLLDEFGIATDTAALLSIVSPEQVATLVRATAAAVSNAGLAILVLALTMTYALAGAESLHARADAALGPDHALLAGVHRFSGELRRFILVRAVLGLFAAVLSVVLLVVVGVPLPALWAFLVFAASFVPNIGVIVALVPPAFLALLGGGLGDAAIVVVGYAAINLVQDNVLQPVVVGTQLNLSPLCVFASVVAWAWILGPAGALLAVPLTSGLVAILEAFPSSAGVAALLRNEPVPPPVAANPPAGMPR
jgi:AI-2 transport protein TqsA